MGNFLNQYAAVLLDMNGTFMFDEDRFGPDQDYHSTYRALGGVRLQPEAVRQSIADCYDRMTAMYDDPALTDSFPQVRDVLAESSALAGLPIAEVELVEGVIAWHELGRVPDEYAAALRRLATTHQLGVVANVWSRKWSWLDELRRAGILDLFATVVISSDGPSMKPSPALFRQALDALSMPPSAVVFVGDSLRCDIGGASAVGLDTVWVDRAGGGPPRSGPLPTFIVPDLLVLVRAFDEVATVKSPQGKS